MQNTSHKNSAFSLLHSLAIYRCSNEKLAGVRIKGFTTLESQLHGWKCGGVWQPRSEERVEQPKLVSRGSLSLFLSVGLSH